MHPQSLFRQMEHERFLQDTHYERRVAGAEEMVAPAATAAGMRAWLRAALSRRV